MKRTFATLIALGMLVVLAPAATADTSDKIAQHQAAIQAKIACHRAQAEGRPCKKGMSVRRSSPSSAARGAGKSIEVDISEQTLRAYDGNRIAIETPVSTGAPGKETPTGHFRINSKEQMHWSNQFNVWMPYAMNVVGGIYIHELPLTDDGRRLGTGSLGRAVSHGCIRVGIGPAQDLYDWTPIGTPVWIH